MQYFITGVSGIGKTTLAMHLSQKLKIPFIQGSSKVLWEKYGIESHLDLLKMAMNEPEKGLAFQWDLLDYRIKETENLKHFITDRSPIDNAVYFLYQNSPYLSEKIVSEYLERCKAYFDDKKESSRIIYLSHQTEPRKIEDDGARITNEHFQNSVIGPIMNQLLYEFAWGPNAIRNIHITRWNWYDRIAEIDRFLVQDIQTLSQELAEELDPTIVK